VAALAQIKNKEWKMKKGSEEMEIGLMETNRNGLMGVMMKELVIELGLANDGEFCINAGDNVNVDGYILTVESTTTLSGGNFQVTFTDNSNIEFVYNNQTEDDLTGSWE